MGRGRGPAKAAGRLMLLGLQQDAERKERQAGAPWSVAAGKLLTHFIFPEPLVRKPGMKGDEPPNGS